MLEMTANPGKFAAWLNEKYPGAYRQITAEDIEDMTTCGVKLGVQAGVQLRCLIKPIEQSGVQL